MPIVKCQFCGIRDTEKVEMVLEAKTSETTGKSKNLYFHNGCYPKELKRREVEAKELAEKDALNDVMKDIYECEYNLPSRHWQMLADLRAGTIRSQKGRKLIKKYREGVPFSVMREAYIMSKSDIRWARLNKKFKNLDQELFYGFRIMENKVNDAFRKMKRNEKQKKRQENIESVRMGSVFEEEFGRKVEYKKQKDEMDISHILGDD